MDEIILINYLQGRSNDKECELVEKWYEESPENRKVLEELYHALFVEEARAAMNNADTELSLRKLKSALRQKESNTISKKPQGGWRCYMPAFAAFLAGVIVAGSIALGILAGQKETSYTVMTEGRQRAQAKLPDGSKVWLNSSTTLTYRTSLWSSERQVSLSGEAYFEVAHDEKSRFVVNSKKAKTSVLGTKFNIRAKENESQIAVTLFDGSVRVSPDGTENEEYILKPGQTLDIDTDSGHASLVEYKQSDDVLLWINERLIFRSYSLLEITNILEKLYDVQFVFEDESVKSGRFTGSFSTDNTPEEILNVLMYTHHFSYKKEKKTIYLSK